MSGKSIVCASLLMVNERKLESENKFFVNPRKIRHRIWLLCRKRNRQHLHRMLHRGLQLYFVLIMKSHLQSYPCPLQINSFWNLGFLLGITIILQIITGIFLSLHYTSDLNSAYSSLFFFIREIYYGWCLRYLHSSGASFVFLFLFLHLGRAISYGSYFYNPNTWFSGILLFIIKIISLSSLILCYSIMLGEVIHRPYVVGQVSTHSRLMVSW